MQFKDFKSEMMTTIYHMKNAMQRVMGPIVQKEGLTVIQIYILHAIAEDNEITVGNLSKCIGLNQGNVSTMCKNIEKLGLIKRTRNLEDERIVTLSLTLEGKKVVNKLHGKFEQFDEIFKDVPMEKLEIISNGLKALDEVMKGVK